MRINNYKPRYSPGPGGPGGHGANHGKVKLNKNTVKTLKRLLGYISSGGYMFKFVLSLVCMVISALVSVKSSLFIGDLIDGYVTPLLGTANPDFSGLANMLKNLGLVFLCGMISNLIMQVLLAMVGHGVLLTIRNDLFGHMQELPIRYFDNNSYGDIMSRYTNDVDSMRQLLSQSVPQVLSSMITIVTVFVSMLRLSPRLTLIEIVSVIIMYVITITIGGASAKYFVLRQKALGGVNGYVEEMLSGQKVVKVFCHEEKSKEAFDEKNDDLCGKTIKANALANIIMPMMGNLGNFKYVIIAMVGGGLAVKGADGFSLGMIGAFLALSKSFNMPVSQISQQINAVVQALAGAERVFNLMDQAPERDDEGVVTMVNVRETASGLEETDERTGIWAWKCPREDGSC